MEDVKIMENMREVLKKTRKAKHKKSRSHHSAKIGETNEDAISEILSKKWMFSSPPTAQKQTNEEHSTKPNAFEMMMSKKPEPLVQISPEVNGIKKKRKYTKKPKYNKPEDEAENKLEEPRPDENIDSRAPDALTNGMLRFLNKALPIVEKVYHEDEAKDEAPKRKRDRTNESSEDTPVAANKKKRKTRDEKILLDANENSLETPSKAVPDDELDTPTYLSGRPKRSCAGKITYESLLSPIKNNTDTPSQRSTRSKASKKVEEDDAIMIEDESPVRPPKKLAPVFVKKVPKPSIDPAVLEARRNFLLLGLPDDLRNSIDKQKHFEDEILSNELIAFPLISHVTQLKGENDNEIITESLWQKSLVKINADETEREELNPPTWQDRERLADCSTRDIVPVIREFSLIEREPIDDVRHLVRQMKESFGDFPTNRLYKQLSHKYQSSKVETNDSDYQSQGDCPKEDNSLFVDIFKPNKLGEFLVNTKPVKELRDFLRTWNEKEKSDYDSEDSLQSSKGPTNFAVLTGEHGSGKTSSIYALANDLNYQVIEINAGTKRNGKKMLQDLSEATQSHRVKNKSGKLLSTEENSIQSSQGTSCDGSSGAKSIILIEDAELVFESDEGFASSIQQLINISKRPVILTTNNRHCQHLQKFIQQNEIMYRRPNNVNQIAKYLSVLSLAANHQISAVATEHLYTLNGHDLRKTINEIEFFIRSERSTATEGNLMKFYERPRREWLQEGRLSYGNKTLSSVCFDSSIVSSFTATAARLRADDDDPYQHHHLMDEMAEFIAERCNVAEFRHDWAHGKQKKIESSISSNLISPSSSDRVLATDYSPILRDICRSEKARSESGRRKANNRGHYLRFLIAPSSFGNDYFNEQCEMFQQ